MFLSTLKIKKNKDFAGEKLLKLSKKIKLLYKEKNSRATKFLLKNSPISEIIEALESINEIELNLFFLAASKGINMGNLFLSFNYQNKIEILEKIHIVILKDLLEDLNADDLFSLIRELSKKLIKKIILNAPPSLREEIKRLEKFEYTEIGSFMNTTVFTLDSKMTIYQSIEYLKKIKDEFDIEEEIYITDQDKKVLGKVKIQDLLFSKAEQDNITSISLSSFSKVSSKEDISYVTEEFSKYQINTMAVVDENDRMIGIINNSDIIPELVLDSTKNVYKFYGITEDISYLASSVFDIVKSRIFWLLAMIVAATFTTYIVDKFETLGVLWTAGISSSVLVPIIPIIASISGNAGSQTTATVIQRIASGELNESHFKRVLKKEIKVAFVIGIILAIFNFLRLIIYFSLITIDKNKFHLKDSRETNLEWDKLFKIAITGALASCLSMFLVVILAKFFGVIIPFLSLRLNYDPAAFSTPVLTTILDTLAFTIFFAIGTFFIYFSISPILGMHVSSGKLVSSFTN